MGAPVGGWTSTTRGKAVMSLVLAQDEKGRTEWRALLILNQASSAHL